MPSEFTRKEIEFIRNTFENQKVLEEAFYKHKTIPNEEMSVDNPDIPRAIKYRHDHLGGMGVERHELMFSIFKKCGLGPRGEMDLDEYKNQEKHRHKEQLMDLREAFKHREYELDAEIEDLKKRLSKIKLVEGG